MLGVEATFEILNVMEYSSARGCMSVIARSVDGGVRLLSKGSDGKVMGILHKDVGKALLDATNANLHLFATQVRACMSQQMPMRYLQAMEVRKRGAAQAGMSSRKYKALYFYYHGSRGWCLGGASITQQTNV